MRECITHQYEYEYGVRLTVALRAGRTDWNDWTNVPPIPKGFTAVRHYCTYFNLTCPRSIVPGLPYWKFTLQGDTLSSIDTLKNRSLAGYGLGY